MGSGGQVPGGGVSRTPAAERNKPLAAACYGGPMTMVTTCAPGGGLSRADLLGEIQTRLEMTEGHVALLRTRWRALPADHPDRGAVLRQLECAAAVAGELESLLTLVGPGSARSPYALVQS